MSKQVKWVQGLFRNDVLVGWKEIAAYLHRSVSTVKRWDREGIVVRRFSSGRPYAFISELDRYHLLVDEAIKFNRRNHG